MSLADRLEQLKQEADTSSTSSSKRPNTLKDFLYIVCFSNRAYYSNNMEGAKALADYLAPISVTSYVGSDDKYNVPDYLLSYELQQLAKILDPYISPDITVPELQRLRRVERQILITTYHEVIPCLY